MIVLDLTISLLLITRWPRMASQLIFELWKSASNKYYVKIFYNEKDVTSDTYFCKGTCLLDYVYLPVCPAVMDPLVGCAPHQNCFGGVEQIPPHQKYFLN